MNKTEVRNLAEILSEVQGKLKVPKNHYNGFGKYNYRNAEDIVDAVKPLLEPHKVALIVTDVLTMIGDRYYIKATAKITDGDNSIEADGYAREDLSRKGMDVSQLTGSTSSYARKYALNGLFAIDDTKDADSDNNANKDSDKSPRIAPVVPIKETPEKESPKTEPVLNYHDKLNTKFRNLCTLVGQEKTVDTMKAIGSTHGSDGVKEEKDVSIQARILIDLDEEIFKQEVVKEENKNGGNK